MTARGGSRASGPATGLVCRECGVEMDERRNVFGDMGFLCPSCWSYVVRQQVRSPERQARDVRIGWWIAAALLLVIAVGVVLTVVGVLGVVAR